MLMIGGKSVVLMQGLPGSGKSSYARALVKCSPEASAFHIEADAFYRDAKGKYKFTVARVPEVRLKCFHLFLQALHGEYDLIIYDNVNLDAAELSPFYLMAQLYARESQLEYSVAVHRIEYPIEKCWERQTHGVPRDVFEIMTKWFKSRGHCVLPEWDVYEIHNIDGLDDLPT